MTTKWEYRTLKLDANPQAGWTTSAGDAEVAHLDRELNALGGDGWELVSSTSTAWHQGNTRFLLYTFKRARRG